MKSTGEPSEKQFLVNRVLSYLVHSIRSTCFDSQGFGSRLRLPCVQTRSDVGHQTLFHFVCAKRAKFEVRQLAKLLAAVSEKSSNCSRLFKRVSDQDQFESH
jgi:hypothetical protein